ncbi:DUF6602 domain-containing protein [Globicatella sulfidifaciens]|uniref:DUF6602 domain-containing protein n=1 Tax=Globicatella sulfidifaciens DSM 15739 TaxID=1121925 RepID=A0A1T4MR00_9LACT|nr:DUF6602 domain-containing protein [Globicatella sulfidifaciens]SJZ69479.1 hypothetical protein SAMN02746011_01524 [Globicatella sulfidifaciens DSM 15739]
MKRNDLYDFIKSTMREMKDEYIRIQKRTKEDPGTAGDQGEENWATLLRDWLPANLQVVTKGRIINEEGDASPQIDVLVLNPEYPRKLIDKKLYLSGGVLAAFECKLTLRSEHIKDAINTAKFLSKLQKTNSNSTPYQELNRPIIYGLLAHSHSWNSDTSNPNQNVENNLERFGTEITEHPREMLDILCVADLACWTAFKTAYMGPLNGIDNAEEIYGFRETTMTSYNQFSYLNNDNDYFSPIGTLISSLYLKLGWHNQYTQSLSKYFNTMNLTGSGQGIQQHWDFNAVFSENLRGQISQRGFSNHIWDEWSLTFP